MKGLIIIITFLSIEGIAQDTIQWDDYQLYRMEIDSSKRKGHIEEVAKLSVMNNSSDIDYMVYYILRQKDNFFINKFYVPERGTSDTHVLKYDSIIFNDNEKALVNLFAKFNEITRPYKCGSHWTPSWINLTRVHLNNSWLLELSKTDGDKIHAIKRSKKPLLNFKCIGIIQNLRERRAINRVLKLIRD